VFRLPHRLNPHSFCARRVVTAALLLAAASPVGAQSSREHPYPVRRATSEIVVDGRVVEEAWADALTLELRYEVRPGENVEPPVRTEMFLAYDDTHLLVAFRCHDPDPSQIRARYTDRDNAWNDDFVGVVLDTFNDERRAYELFVNAYGVQMDAVNDDVAGNYDMAWGAIWDSAGRITDAGYEVEMAIPFNQIRFQDADGAQTWGIDGVRSYPRLQTRPHGDVLFTTRFERSDQIDFAHARAGTEVRFQPAGTVNLGRHWLLQYTHTFNAFDLPQGRLFSANVAEPRLVYQINTRTFVRAILQFTDIRRDTSLYRDPVEAEDRRLFTQFLFSYKVNPQTVLYLGYSDNSVGAQQFGLLRADRTFFVKAGYAWLL